MRKVFPLCGPKTSYFFMIMSAWGVIFLGILGIFFYSQAVTLFPDLSFNEEEPLTTISIEQKYAEKATQCWIAAGMYFVTLIGVFWQNSFRISSSS